MPRKQLPIIIIGAGPAGSLAAIVLARAGKEVILFDQHEFPRDKVCGECLSALGIQVLEHYGLLPMLESAGAVRLDRMMLHSPLGGTACAQLPRPMLGLSRAVMDDLLVRSAAAAGAQVRLRCRCESVATGRVRLRDLERNRLETLDADLILLADGKSSLLPGRVADPAGFGIKAHFNCPNAIPNTIELFGAKSCYGGIAPIEHGQFNLAFAIPKSRIRPDLDALLNQIASENPALRNRLRNATRLSDFLASPLPRFSVRGDWPPGIIPLGNAAAAIEPIGGEGMGLALRSAQIVCEQLLQADSVDSASIQRAYNRLWQMRSVICRAGGWMISRPMLCEVSARCLEANQTLASIVFSLAGKRAMSEPSTAR